MKNVKNKKEERKIAVPQSEYRRLHRREQQLLRAKNHARELWRTLKQIEV